jgi:hypothetical protein
MTDAKYWSDEVLNSSVLVTVIFGGNPSNNLYSPGLNFQKIEFLLTCATKSVLELIELPKRMRRLRLWNIQKQIRGSSRLQLRNGLVAISPYKMAMFPLPGCQFLVSIEH